MSITHNLSIDQGANYTATVTISSSNGSALNITNYVGKSQLRRSYDSNTSVNFTVTNTDPTNGILTMSLSNAQTTALVSGYGRYVYDLKIITSNNTTRVIEGYATIKPQSSKQ